MKLKKITRLALAGALAACMALCFAGCFGVGGGSSSGSGGSSSGGSSSGYSYGSGGSTNDNGGSASSGTDSSSGSGGSDSGSASSGTDSSSSSGGSSTSTVQDTSKVGTWELSYATDIYGSAYDIASIGPENVRLVVTSETTATFYYFDDDPFSGSLDRSPDDDADFATDGYEVQAYRLRDGSGSAWLMAFVIPDDGSDCFFYLELYDDGSEDHLFLDRVSKSTAVTPAPSSSSTSGDPKVGTWVIDAAEDADGNWYDDAVIAAATVKLVIRADGSGTFQYFDNDLFSGTLEAGEVAQGSNAVYTDYDLVASDGSYWALTFVEPTNGNDNYWYVKVGYEGEEDVLYLAKAA